MGAKGTELEPVLSKADEAADYGCPGARHLCFDSAANGDLGKDLESTTRWATRKAERVLSGEIPNLNPQDTITPKYFFYNSNTFKLAFAAITGKPCNITLNEKSVNGQTIYQS